MNLYSFITQHDSTLNLIIEQEFPDKRCVGGKYSLETHSITLFQRDIQIQCKRALGSLDRLQEYSLIVCSHELGHALDKTLPDLSEELALTGNLDILYKIEVNAWNIAEKLIPFTSRELFLKIREESLFHCRKRPLVS
ncbi:hypothetical protein ACN6MY_07170 [Peribacillus sp. B-H-3]|uniref:hypothetical protein n=1 Tax=Peribacillus sp. B-H-3 TaxID=3400420 RepID=UPI003B02171A